MLGVERMPQDATGAGDRRDAAAQGSWRIAFTGSGQISSNSFGLRRQAGKIMLVAPGLEMRHVGSIGFDSAWRVGSVLIGLRLGKRHGGGRAFRPRGGRLRKLTLARSGENISHFRQETMITRDNIHSRVLLSNKKTHYSVYLVDLVKHMRALLQWPRYPTLPLSHTASAPMKITLEDFQRDIDRYMDAAVIEPVFITKDGCDYLVMISETAYRHLIAPVRSDRT